MVELVCEDCGCVVRREKYEATRSAPVCKPCSDVRKGWGARGKPATRDQSGPNNPCWKGGSRQWVAGKLGRDKDGLSWKVQRKLAWERDHYRCTVPGCTSPTTRKPDVHHKNPYRLSFSHHLDNLECLCRSHHKEAEARIMALWGGKPFGGSKRPDNQPRCRFCGCKTAGGVCSDCDFDLGIRPRLEELVLKGLSQVAIGKELGVGYRTVWYWLHEGRRFKRS